jgi:hypothetical protein
MWNRLAGMPPRNVERKSQTITILMNWFEARATD